MANFMQQFNYEDVSAKHASESFWQGNFDCQI